MRIYFWSCFFFVGMLLSSCLPTNRPDDISDLSVVYTNFNPDFEFTQGITYALPPHVIVLTPEGITPGERPPILDFVPNQQVLTAIRNNMNARGFTLTTIQNQPDYLLLPTVTREGRDIIFNYDASFWTWWYPELVSGIGFDYPNFSPLINNSFNTGTLLMQLVDNRSRSSSAPIPVQWVGVINIGLSESTSDNASRIVQGINQAFSQTPSVSQ